MVEDIPAQQLIGKREVYLRSGHRCRATGLVNEHVPAEQALAVLDWLEQQRYPLQQAALGRPRKADQQVADAQTPDGSGEGLHR